MFLRKKFSHCIVIKRLISNSLHNEILTADHESKVFHIFSKYYITRDPASYALGISREDVEHAFSRLYLYCAHMPISMGIFTEKERMVGFLLSILRDRDMTVPEAEYRNLNQKLVPRILLDKRFEDKVVTVAPEVKLWFRLFIGSVHPDFAGQGVAKEMWRLSVDKAKEFGCGGVYALCTAMESQIGLGHLGFNEAATISYKNFEDSYGNRPFEKITNPESAKLMVKIF